MERALVVNSPTIFQSLHRNDINTLFDWTNRPLLYQKKYFLFFLIQTMTPLTPTGLGLPLASSHMEFRSSNFAPVTHLCHRVLLTQFTRQCRNAFLSETVGHKRSAYQWASAISKQLIHWASCLRLETNISPKAVSVWLQYYWQVSLSIPTHPDTYFTFPSRSISSGTTSFTGCMDKRELTATTVRLHYSHKTWRRPICT